MGQVAVYSDVERRRRWSDEERLQILSEAFSPGAIVTQVARRYDISTALIYTWRRKLCEAQIEPAAACLIRGSLKPLWRRTRLYSIRTRHRSLSSIYLVDDG